MQKELVLGKVGTKDLFMAALLLCTSNFKGAKVRVLNNEESSCAVNVNRENILKFCPSWASSELMLRMIQCKVCDPILENNKLGVREKVQEIKKSLEYYAKKEGIEMPA